jgi:hypothetical protein
MRKMIQVLKYVPVDFECEAEGIRMAFCLEEGYYVQCSDHHDNIRCAVNSDIHQHPVNIQRGVVMLFNGHSFFPAEDSVQQAYVSFLAEKHLLQ